ncbi:uncharacterized protein LOC121787067 isoform X2 [Salvia splendens]|uniref:uncharacterized protein LOC121787067 isoform X2 n=1 Tax=Salvia splendens TaxID=180675 RepID=UPI001C27B8EC|nr:uncharacterized protein LOC121787067 isoform X2 [Salvia splendens]
MPSLDSESNYCSKIFRASFKSQRRNSGDRFSQLDSPLIGSNPHQDEIRTRVSRSRWKYSQNLLGRKYTLLCWHNMQIHPIEPSEKLHVESHRCCTPIQTSAGSPGNREAAAMRQLFTDPTDTFWRISAENRDPQKLNLSNSWSSCMNINEISPTTLLQERSRA